MTDDDKLRRIASEIFDDGVTSTEWMREHYGLTDEEMDRVMEMLEGER